MSLIAVSVWLSLGLPHGEFNRKRFLGGGTPVEKIQTCSRSVVIIANCSVIRKAHKSKEFAADIANTCAI